MTCCTWYAHSMSPSTRKRRFIRSATWMPTRIDRLVKESVGQSGTNLLYHSAIDKTEICWWPRDRLWCMNGLPSSEKSSMSRPGTPRAASSSTD